MYRSLIGMWCQHFDWYHFSTGGSNWGVVIWPWNYCQLVPVRNCIRSYMESHVWSLPRCIFSMHQLRPYSIPCGAHSSYKCIQIITRFAAKFVQYINGLSTTICGLFLFKILKHQMTRCSLLYCNWCPIVNYSLNLLWLSLVGSRQNASVYHLALDVTGQCSPLWIDKYGFVLCLLQDCFKGASCWRGERVGS